MADSRRRARFFLGTLKTEDSMLSRIKKTVNKNLPTDPLVWILIIEDSKKSRIKKKGRVYINIPTDPWVRILKNEDSKLSSIQKKGNQILPSLVTGSLIMTIVSQAGSKRRAIRFYQGTHGLISLRMKIVS